MAVGRSAQRLPAIPCGSAETRRAAAKMYRASDEVRRQHISGAEQATSRIGIGRRQDGTVWGRDVPGIDHRGARSGHLHRSDEFLGLIESHGLTGAWSWHFRTEEHVWTPGCFHLLGLDPRSVTPSYDALLGLVHPGDRLGMARPADLKRGEAPSTQTFRIIRPDGTTRVLRSRSDIKFGLDGRPRSALGTLVDVTDRERDLRAQTSYRNSIQTLDRQVGAARFTLTPDRGFDFEPAAGDVLGVPLALLNADPFSTLPPRERADIRSLLDGRHASTNPLVRTVTLNPPGRPPSPCRLAMAPLFGEQRDLQGWQGLLQILDAPAADDETGTDVDALLLGCHVRAARALLDWSTGDLAAASGLSLSTVRRLEADDPSRCLRSRSGIVSTLCRAGIEFCRLDDGRVGISRAV